MKNTASYNSYIGKKVAKKFKTSFKSGSKVNTVAGVTLNTLTGQPAFTFEEDDSSVECSLCVEVVELNHDNSIA